MFRIQYSTGPAENVEDLEKETAGSEENCTKKLDSLHKNKIIKAFLEEKGGFYGKKVAFLMECTECLGSWQHMGKTATFPKKAGGSK